jgi:hypothetical protein
MLTKYHKTITGGGKTVDAVQRILAIAERERRKRAQKEKPGQTQPLQTVRGKDKGPELDTHLSPIKHSTGFR